MLSRSCARSRLKVPHENTLIPLARFLRAVAGRNTHILGILIYQTTLLAFLYLMVVKVIHIGRC